MEKHDVEFLGSLLSEKPEAVEQAITEGTLSEKIKALNLMKQDEVEKLKTNLTNQVKENHISELVESAKAGEIDKALYGVIKGAATERTERNLAKEYGITEYSGINDLVSKAISKNKGQTDDTQIQELNQKILDLQGVNVKLVSETKDAVTAAEKKANDKILQRDKRDLVNGVPFDFSDVEQANLEKISGQRRQIVESVFDSRYSLVFEGDKTVVKDKEGNLIKNPATLEPITPSDVMNLIPVELGIKVKSSESGGQGGKSSAGKGDARFNDVAEFNQYCSDKGILSTGPEGIAIWAKRKPQ